MLPVSLDGPLKGAVWQTARVYARTPALTVAVLVAVALGVGASTTILSVVDAGWLRPLPFDDASSLVSVWLQSPSTGGDERIPLTGADLADIRSEPGLFGAVAGWEPTAPVVADPLGSEMLPAAAVSEGMFSRVLRIHPVLGRTFLGEEDRPDGTPTAILSHGFWMERYGGEPAVIGRSLVLDGVPHVVVGVMPGDFHPPFRPDALFWTPARLSTERCRGDCRAVPVVARLAPGTTLPVARDRGAALMARLGESHPATHADLTLAVSDLGRDRSALSHEAVRALLLTGVLVLLIASVNVALLLMARGRARTGEMAVRASVGAPTPVMVRQLTGEGVLLTLVGGLLGVGLAVWSVEGLERMAGGRLVGVRPVEVDIAIMLTGMGLASLVGVVSSLLPAFLVAGRPALPVGVEDRWMRGESPASRRIGSLVVAVEMALALLLAVGAGATLDGLHARTGESLGVRGESLLVMTVPLPADRFRDASRRAEMATAIHDAVAAIPGTFSVGLTGSLPMDAEGERAVPVSVEGDVEDPSRPSWRSRIRAVSSGYFYTVGQRLAAGRGFQPRDDAAGAPVAVVDTRAARLLFSRPPRSPLGERVAVGRSPQEVWRTVIGVVEPAPGEDVAAGPVVYVPMAQAPPYRPTVVARMDVEPASRVEAARAALIELDPTLAPSRIGPWDEVVRDAFSRERLTAGLASLLALLALLLSMVGLYGLLAHDVSRRVRELAVRKAVGATAEELAYGMAGTATALVLSGVAGGGVAAGFLLDIGTGWPAPASPLVFAGAVTLVGLGAAAAALPAVRRSASVEAAVALGRE